MVCALLALSIAPAVAKTVPVKTWVNGICTNLVEWQNDLEQQSNTFQSTVTDSSTIAEVKAMFVDFLDGAITSTKTMIAGLPTGVYCPVKCRAPVFGSTVKVVMASLR